MGISNLILCWKTRSRIWRNIWRDVYKLQPYRLEEHFTRRSTGTGRPMQI